MQLVAYGAQDIYLTGNPQITFFKVVYRRHTNFSMEAIQQTVNGTSTLAASSTTTGTVTVSRNGDLVSNVYVRCNQDTSNGISGDKLITDVELEIGGQRIDKHNQEWLQVWAELTTPESKASGYKYLTGGQSNTLVSGGETNQQSIMVPLQFWFCRNPGLALPLIALQYHEVKIKFTWSSGNDASRDNSGATPSCEVWADYIYLDTDERRRFAQVSHEYLIEQLQYDNVNSDKTAVTLNFNHPVKELIWTEGGSTAHTSQTAKLTLNGHDRFAAQTREYFQIRQPLDHHTAVPGYNIKESDRPVMISPIDTTILTHHATVDDGKAKLTATTLKVDAVDHAAAPIKVGDVLQIVVGGNLITLAHSGDATPNTISANYARAETNVYTVEVKSSDGASDPTFTFSTAIPTDHIYTNLANDDGLSVTIIGRIQDPKSRCSQLAANVNVYSFALKPEEHQPSGTCNFSRIDNAQLVFSSATGVNTLYAVNYNVLRIMSGMGGLAYSN